MADVPAASLVPIRDALSAEVANLTALIGVVPPTNVTINAGDGGAITTGGHIWTFGAAVDARGAIILRDGVQYASGVARTLVLSAGVLWAQAGPDPGTWYRDTGTLWMGGAGP